MTGPEHYRASEQLLSDASFADSYGNPVHRDGTLMDPRQHASLNNRARTHATLALAAATALQAALPLIGDDQQVTEWGRAVGATADTNQGAIISAARGLLRDMEDVNMIPPAAAETLRAALAGKDGDQ